MENNKEIKSFQRTYILRLKVYNSNWKTYLYSFKKKNLEKKIYLLKMEPNISFGLKLPEEILCKC